MSAAVQEQHERCGYDDCRFCKGWGFYLASTGQASEEKIWCGNCSERRKWEGLNREPQSAWCVWTKTGRRPSYWHESREMAEAEAARLARLNPGKTFIVFEKLVNIRAQEASGG